MAAAKRFTLLILCLFILGCATTPTPPEDAIVQCRKGFVTVYAPHVVEALSFYGEMKGPVWVWTTTFIEESGVRGVTLTHRLTRVKAPDGKVWQAIDSAGNFLDKVPIKIRIDPGGKAIFKHWTYDTEHNMCNGICSTIFYGKDDNGEEVVLTTMVFLSHKNCPKKKF
ncbi:MAG: hypothetical protein QXR60_02340 [Candidatus Nanoarchaeia archaeon]